MDINDPALSDVITNATSRIDLWAKLLQTVNAKTLLEVGVWKGEYAEQVLKRCPAIEKYYMIDPWATLPDWNKPFNVAPKAFEEVYAEAMNRTEFASSKRVILKGRTKEVIDRVPANSLDFAYIDGDHTLRGITIDMIKLLPKIKEGGFIGGDDFTNTPWQHGIQFEPTLVCPFSVYFAEAMDMPIVALPFDQFIMQKVSNSGFTFADPTGSYRDISLNRLPLSVFKSAIKGKVKRLFRQPG
jgi:hypothetical protein